MWTDSVHSITKVETGTKASILEENDTDMGLLYGHRDKNTSDNTWTAKDQVSVWHISVRVDDTKDNIWIASFTAEEHSFPAID
jgi:hypothetical protein